MGSGYSKMKKKAKLMQAQMQQHKEEMQQLEVVGKAGGELVQITVNGEKEIKKVLIHPDCVDKEDVEGLQDLVLEAFRDAFHQIAEKNTGEPNFFS